MNIAYFFQHDAADPAVQSGRPAAILEELRRQGVGIEPVFPLRSRPAPGWFTKKILHRLLGRFYRWDREPLRLAAFASEFRARTARAEIDAIFSPGSEAISQLTTELPITFCADATFANLIDYYGDFTHVADEYLRQGHAQEAAALARARLAVYPSEWAARSAVESYRADPARIAVIPFGANLGRHNARQQVWNWIESRPRDCLRLLFVGRHWLRKGGEIVAATAERLRQSGWRVELDIVGCTTPARYRSLPWVRAHGLLRSHVPVEVDRLTRLFAQAHFLFVPSRAEAYGLVFAEGNAFGLPTVATATGGITSVVRHGWNGLLCPSTADCGDYAAAIANSFLEQATYRQLCRQAFEEFERRLNWRVFCQQYLARVSEQLRRGDRSPGQREPAALAIGAG